MNFSTLKITFYFEKSSDKNSFGGGGETWNFWSKFRFVGSKFLFAKKVPFWNFCQKIAKNGFFLVYSKKIAPNFQNIGSLFLFSKKVPFWNFCQKIARNRFFSVYSKKNIPSFISTGRASRGERRSASAHEERHLESTTQRAPCRFCRTESTTQIAPR